MPPCCAPAVRVGDTADRGRPGGGVRPKGKPLNAFIPAQLLPHQPCTLLRAPLVKLPARYSLQSLTALVLVLLQATEARLAALEEALQTSTAEAVAKLEGELAELSAHVDKVRSRPG